MNEQDIIREFYTAQTNATDQLFELAMKMKTYHDAIKWLGKQKTEMPQSYSATTAQVMQTAWNSIIDDVIRKVRDTAFQKEITK